ncbi:MAG: MMPL family transporter, partial [Euryarchaeota archaeon]|nr:MMPL family transporter [Euryarchaeota archaeon]
YSLADTPSIRHFVTGSDAISVDQKSSTDADMERIDPITIVLVFILIGLFFRSFVASSVPPAVIGIALGVTFAIVYVLGAYVLSVHYSVLTLTLTSMMGAGCDYCIFILSRYREERHNGLSKEESVKTAVTWAGESIATSGATVIIGFGVLSLGRFEMLKSMGIGLATGISIALLAALTLLPAVLMLLGDRMFWPAKMKPKVRKEGKEGYFTKSAKFAVKHAKAIVIAAVLVSVPATYTVLTLETSYDFIEAMPVTESRQGLDLMGESFGAGRMTPTLVAMEMSSPVIVGDTWNQSQLDSIEVLSYDLAQLSNVNSVVSPTRPLGEAEPINYSNLSAYPAEEAAQYAALMKGMLGTENTSVVLITVTFVEDPFARESIESIQQIRSLVVTFAAEEELVTAVYVGGATAGMYDISNLVWEDFEMMEVFVIIGIYIVLMVVLGSLVSPLRSILTILLSISWTLAVTMILFTYLQGIPILWLMPMILTIVCLGLGMDYDIFITTRIREEAQKGKSDREAIVHAMEKTGGIITACGIIMAGAFGTMMLSEGALLREFGFALAFAILLDSIVVRIYLVPAIVSLLGKWNWYAPGRLQRVRREEKK